MFLDLNFITFWEYSLENAAIDPAIAQYGTDYDKNKFHSKIDVKLLQRNSGQTLSVLVKLRPNAQMQTIDILLDILFGQPQILKQY